MNNEYYEVCGREWFNDVMKLKKSVIIELYKKALQKEIITKDQAEQNQVERGGCITLAEKWNQLPKAAR